MQIKPPSLSHGKFKLVKNNKDIIELSEKMTVVYLGEGGDHIQLMVDMPEGPQLVQNVLVRKDSNDLIIDYIDGEDAKKVILEDFFLASAVNPHHLTMAHPDKADFSIASHVEPVQLLDDGSSLIYLYGEHAVLAGLVENYVIDHYYEFDTYDHEKEDIKDDKVSTEDAHTTLSQKAGTILGVLAAGIVGRQIFDDRKKNNDAEKQKNALKDTEKTIESITEPTDTLTLVEGVISLGPVIPGHGLSVQVMSESGQLLSIVDVDENGHYSLKVNNIHQQVKLVLLDKSDTPDYRDEATGETKNMSGYLTAWAAVDSSLPTNIVHINPLTTIAVALAITEAFDSEQGLSNAQLSMINRQVAKAFIGREVDVTTYNIESAIDQTGYPLKGNEGGAALAVISALEAKNNQTTTDVIDSLVAGLHMNNGVLNVSADVVQQLSDAQAFLGDKFGDTGAQVIDRMQAVAASTNAQPTSSSQERYIDEDTTFSFSLADFVFNDGNPEDSLQTVTLTALPEAGHIELAGEAIVAGQTVTADEIPTLIFYPVGNDSSVDYGRVVFTVSDGVAQSVKQHIDIHVRAVNDKPTTIESMIGEVAEDVAFTVSEAQLLTLVTDIDSAVLSIEDVSVASEQGQVVYNGDGTWTFTPANDLIDDALALSITVSDKIVTEKFNTFLKITNVNDAPIANDDGFLPTPLVPVLQSNEEQGLHVTSSSAISEGVEPFQAFDGVLGDSSSDTGRWVSADTSGWLQVDFGRGTTIYRYDMSGGDNPLDAPKSWQLLGSHDGVNYTVLDTQEAVSGFAASTAQSFILSEPASYQLFKLVVTENQGGDHLILDQMQFYPATLDIDVNTTEDLPFTLDVLKNDRDIDPNDVITLKTALVVDENGIAIQDSGAVTIIGNQLVFVPSTHFEHLIAGTHTLVKVIYTIQDLAGASSEAAVYLRVNGVDDLSVMSGDVTGSVIEGADIEVATGGLVVTDIDSAETVVPQILTGDYGTFTLLASGQWSYQLDNTSDTLDVLHDDRQAQDVFTVAASDGTENTVTITVHGHTDNHAPTLDVTMTPTMTQSWLETPPVEGSIEGSIAASELLINVQDVDEGSPGMVVFQAVEGMYYSTDAGASWLDLSQASTSNGILLNPQARLYAMHDLEGGNLIGFRAWDSEQGVSGTAGIDLTDPEYLGGGWAYSAMADAAQTLISSPIEPPYYTAKYLFSGQNDFFTDAQTGDINTLVSADVNQDGLMDFVFESDDTVFWLGQKASDGIQETLVYHKVTVPSTFSETQGKVFLAVSGDSFVDLIAIHENVLGYYPQQENGSFSQTPASTFDLNSQYNNVMSAIDVDADGQKEIVLTSAAMDRSLMVLHLDQEEGFTNVSDQFPTIRDINQLATGDSGSMSTMAAGDFNGDSRIDFYLHSTMDDATLFLQNADGSYTPTTFAGLLHDNDGNLLTEVPDNYALTTTDIDGDGLINDIIFVGEGIAIAYFWDASLPGFRQMDANTQASISGVDTGLVVEDAASQLTVKAKLDVRDVDVDQDAFIPSSETNTYGELSIDAAGFWHYRADNQQDNIQALGEDVVVTDAFIVKTIDGTEHPVVISIKGTNDAPTAASHRLTVDEDTTIQLSVANFGYADIDSDPLAAVLIKTLPSTGQLTINGTVIEAGQRVASADIALLAFTPALHANGDHNDSFTFKTDDGLTYSTANYQLSFDVLPVNDAPTTVNKTVRVNEDGSYTFTPEDFGFSDVDPDTLITVVIDSLATNGSLQLQGSAVVAGQSIAVADLGHLVFTPVAHAHGENYDSFSFKVNDGTTNSAATTQISVDVTSVNDAPIASNNEITLNEDSEHLFSAADFGYNDIDQNPLVSIMIESLPINGSLSLNGSAISVGQSIVAGDIGQLGYAPLAHANGDAYDSFRFKVNDGLVNSEVANQITFDVTPVNDLPLGADNTLSVNEGDSHTFSADDFGFSDIDADTLFAITIEALPTKGHLTLNDIAVTVDQSIDVLALSGLVFRPDGSDTGVNYDGFQFTVNDGSALSAATYHITFDVMTVNAAPSAANKSITLAEDAAYSFTVADFGYSDTDADALVAVVVESLPVNGSLLLSGVAVTAGQSIATADIPTLAFTPSANDHGANYSSFRFKVSDGTVNSTLANQITFDVTALNDAPTAVNNSIMFFEDGSHTFTGADFGYHDIDDDTIASIVIDVLPANGSLEVSGTPVTAGQSISIFDVGNLVFTAAANASGMNYDSFSFKVNDGAENSVEAYQMTFDVAPVNDAPTATNNSITLTEDGRHSFTLGDFGYSDVESDAFSSLSIQLLPVNGSLELNGSAVTVGQSIAAVDIPDLSFDPAANANGNDYDRFSFKVNDGLVNSLSINQMIVDVTPVNDAPVGSDATVMLEEDSAYTFKASDFSFSDAESADLTAVVIETLPTQGSLTVNTDTVTLGQSIALLDIDALIFTPAADGHGATYDSFTFKVNDGTLSSDTANQITFHVIADNDAPEIDESALDQMDFTWAGGGIVNKVPDTYDFADDYAVGDAIWLSLTDGSYRKAVQIKIDDNDDGTLTIKTLAAKYVDISVWTGLTDLQKSTYFETQGHENLLATTDAQSGYSIKDVSINSGGVAAGIVDDSTGKNIVHPHFHLSENAASGVLVADLSAVDPEGDTLTYSLLDNADGRFSIESSTGVIRSADMTTVNFEDDATYGVTVQVSDGEAVDVEHYQIAVDDYMSDDVVMHAYATDALTANTFIYDPDGIQQITVTQPAYGETLLIDEVYGFALSYDTRDNDGHLAAIEGGVIISEGSAKFDGTGMITIGDGATAKDLVPSTAITVSTWVKVDSNAAAKVGMVGLIQANDASEKGWILGHDADKFYFGLASESTGSLTNLSAPAELTIDTDRWYHVAGTYDGSDMTLFVDGSPVASSTVQSGAIDYPTDASTVFQMGAYKDEDEDRRLDGELKDVRIYDQALIAEDVTAVMNDTTLNNFYFKPLADFDDLNINDSRDASFTYTLEKATGESTTSDVSVTVSHNFPATPTFIDLGNVNEDTQMLITQQQLLSGATDPEDDFLRVVTVTTDNGNQGAISNNGNETFTFIPTTDFYGDNVQLNYQVQEYKDVTVMDFSNGLEQGWTSVGYDVEVSGGAFGTSPDGSPILELDAVEWEDSLSYSVETRGQETILRLSVKSRSATDHIDVKWDGTIVQTIDPTDSWQDIEIILPSTGVPVSTLTLSEVSEQNDSFGPLISHVSMSSGIVNLTSNSAYVDVNAVNDIPILAAPTQAQPVNYLDVNSLSDVNVLGGKTSNYTIGGSEFTDLNAKLNHASNFDENGLFTQVNLSIVSTASTITQGYLDQGRLYFDGQTVDADYTASELQLLESYVTGGNYLLSTNDSDTSDPVSSYFGLPAGADGNVSSEWVIENIDHALINGDVGLGIDLRGQSIVVTGSYSGFSDSDLQSDDIVLARDAQNNLPTLLIRPLGSGYLFFAGNEGIFSDVSSATHEFDATDNEDVLAAAILDWAFEGVSSGIFDWEQGETKIITSAHMSATDVEIDNNDIVFTLSNIQHASVEGATDNGDGSYSFTQKQLTDGELSLTHDNSETALSYDITVSDGELDSATLTGYVSSFKVLNVSSGLPYQLVLNEDGNDVSLLEPSIVGNNSYYVLDRNHDNQISSDDKFSLDDLTTFMHASDTLDFGGKQLALPTVDELTAAGYVDPDDLAADTQVPFWHSDDTHTDEWLLTVLNPEQQTDGYVVYHVIG